MSHAPFIWSAYGITAIILLWTAISPVLRLSRFKRDLRQLADQEQSGPGTIT